MHLVVDENLSLIDHFFAEFGAISALAGRQITQNDLQDADALLVRSVTRVSPLLLSGTPVQFVGSATIGTDHLDVDGLQAAGITVAHAAGCNAQAVAEYVVTAILTLQPQRLLAGEDFCLGVVGMGNVGRRLAGLAKRLGWRVLCCDPLVHCFNVEQVDLDALLAQADAVSLHVPMTRSGQHATYHLINAQRLALMPPHAMLINSARGAVVEQAALLADLARTQRPVVLDVFEFEPDIPRVLLDQLALATPHIAGYSLEGKAQGTYQIYQQFCQWRQLAATRDLGGTLPDMPNYFMSNDCATTGSTNENSLHKVLAAYLFCFYDIRRDDAALRGCLHGDGVAANAFDRLRREYPLRREWSAYGDTAHA